MTPVAFILGAGRHVGLAVRQNEQEGYKVAVDLETLSKRRVWSPSPSTPRIRLLSLAFAEVKETWLSSKRRVFMVGSLISLYVAGRKRA